MNTKEAAEYLGNVTARTIVAWIHAGRLKATRNATKRGQFRIEKEDLDEAFAYRPVVEATWPSTSPATPDA